MPEPRDQPRGDSLEPSRRPSRRAVLIGAGAAAVVVAAGVPTAMALRPRPATPVTTLLEADPDLLSSTQESWTVLGMDYKGAAEQWRLAKALGKPLIGHVVPTAQAGESALALGALGLMISGITETLGHLPKAD